MADNLPILKEPKPDAKEERPEWRYVVSGIGYGSHLVLAFTVIIVVVLMLANDHELSVFFALWGATLGIVVLPLSGIGILASVVVARRNPPLILLIVLLAISTGLVVLIETGWAEGSPVLTKLESALPLVYAAASLFFGLRFVLQSLRNHRTARLLVFLLLALVILAMAVSFSPWPG